MKITATQILTNKEERIMNQDQVDKLTATIDAMGERMGLPLGSKPWRKDARICDQVSIGFNKRPSKSQRIHDRKVRTILNRINRMHEDKPTSSAS